MPAYESVKPSHLHKSGRDVELRLFGERDESHTSAMVAVGSFRKEDI